MSHADCDTSVDRAPRSNGKWTMPSFTRVSFWIAVIGYASAQTTAFEGQSAIVLSNGRLSVTLLEQGATLASVVLTSDHDAPDPLWNPIRLARENGRAVDFNGAFGHFVCVDGFGQPSASERAAGLPGHGEAHLLRFSAKSEHASRSPQMRA